MPIGTGSAVETALGTDHDTAETDPTAESAITNALLRGILTILADVWDSETNTIRTSTE